MTSSILKRRAGSRARGFTLIELLVVSAISIVLMTVGAFIYSNCLKIYQEGLGVQSVFETSKYINRDLRTYLGNVVPVPGAFISPKTKLFPPIPDATQANLDSFYWAGWLRPNAYTNRNDVANPWGFPYYDKYFSGAQTTQADWEEGHVGWARQGGGWSSDEPWSYCSGVMAGPEPSAWWMPGFFGKRDGANANILKYYDLRVASFGWPQADYRMDADADKLGSVLYPAGGGAGGPGGGGAPGGGGGAPGGGPAMPGTGQVVSCWFYAEDRNFDSVHTQALDNANIVLVSIKFSMDLVNNREETQLSFLRHHMCGFDGNGQKWLRADQTYANMLRSIKIDPIYVDNAGAMQVMDDNAIGCDLLGTPKTGAGVGLAIPRAFDIRYTLINPANQKRHRFSLRVYCQSNMQ